MHQGRIYAAEVGSNKVHINQSVIFFPAKVPIDPFLAFLSSWLKSTVELPVFLGAPLGAPYPP
jgi:hypothetical protein